MGCKLCEASEQIRMKRDESKKVESPLRVVGETIISAWSVWVVLGFHAVT